MMFLGVKRSAGCYNGTDLRKSYISLPRQTQHSTQVS